MDFNSITDLQYLLGLLMGTCLCLGNFSISLYLKLRANRKNWKWLEERRNLIKNRLDYIATCEIACKENNWKQDGVASAAYLQNIAKGVEDIIGSLKEAEKK